MKLVPINVSPHGNSLSACFWSCFVESRPGLTPCLGSWGRWEEFEGGSYKIWVQGRRGGGRRRGGCSHIPYSCTKASNSEKKSKNESAQIMRQTLLNWKISLTILYISILSMKRTKEEHYTPFFIADILTCQGRNNAGVNNNVSDGCFSLSVE